MKAFKVTESSITNFTQRFNIKQVRKCNRKQFRYDQIIPN